VQIEVDAEFPEKLAFLFEPAPYKVLYGGRGGAKSWGIARALLIIGAQRPIRVLCARQIMSSISESVHELLKQQVFALNLAHFYEIQNAGIFGANGTEFTYAGLRHNIGKIKSYEGADIAWVEEAADVSKNSWETLIPTIRKDGSEIWISFNPELDTDETYRRFVLKPPTGAKVVKVNHSDNKWFPTRLKQEMADLREADFDAYLTVYEGQTRQTLDGAVYARELRQAAKDERITRVPYDPSKPVHTFWDLGRADMTAIWFAQLIGFETRIIDYYENSGYALDHYLKELQSKPYVYGEDWLPHDASSKLLASARTIEQQVRDFGRKPRIVPNLSMVNGLNAARSIFSSAWFDEVHCADGLQALRHYQYKVDPETGQRSKEPLHNWASHGADAFRYLAVALKEAPKKPVSKFVPPQAHIGGAQGWMR